MGTLGDQLPEEQARVREILGHYKAVGPPGKFGAAIIEQVLQRADKAVIGGDIVAMLASYKELKEIED